MAVKARFGPAGNSKAFYDQGNKATVEAPEWLAKQGLTAYEFQSGRGVNVGQETANNIGEQGKKHDIEISMHAPYYISLASKEEHKRDNSVMYITQSAEAVDWMGGNRIVVHPGGLNGRTREEATAIASDTLKKAQVALDEQGYGHIHICPEVMGKINQLGNLEEVLTFCKLDERMLPCVDFGHLNARTRGEVNSAEAFKKVLDMVENEIGIDRARIMHVHFSKIEYTDGGERMHLTFDDTEFGPEPGPLMNLFAQRSYTPFVICESRDTQSDDALILKEMFEKAKSTL